MFDNYTITNLSLDVRKYFYFNHVGLAFRTLHYGRYGKDASNIYPLFLGNEYLVRGYNFNAFFKTDNNSENGLDLYKIMGSKIIVFNSEIRIPFTGVKRFSLIKSGYLFSDIILFFDAGLTWNKDKFPWLSTSDIRYYWNPTPNYYTPIYSLGASIRINLFGYAILEPYIAMPFQINDVTYSTGFIISGGGW
jgi:outer membrane protein assembly factor BamA